MNFHRLLLFFVFASGISNITAQVLKETKAKIDNVDFNFIDSVVVIKYDLTNAKSDERFDVSVSIYKAATDTKIDARTFSGDLFNQAPGRNKSITWELASDITYLDDNIYILLEAKHLNPVTIPYSSKKLALLQSTAFPGWGTSKISMNKYHLVKGVAAYSLIALSIKSNYDAANYYEKYKDAIETDTRDNYFEKAKTSYSNSFIYAGGAAAIWIGEYLWLWMAPNKTDALEMSRRKLSLNYNYNPALQTPVFILTYNF